ncbi:hypothetical protein CBR_g40869 [Chara braunii]|uniref:Integrase catalytic domain-containing protein n=1 Tax=Chara braunii TaxID=69332 RepID=A0A388K2B9_CHABU|nr:hypothetical protein CBR_g40869 [Chara braunii]|eukprot:GBG64169.1 hypothetical protein CBR_g40869 [Chara braunii]
MATSAMVTSAQQTSQASSSGIIGSTVAQTVSQSTGVMASQAAVLTPEDVAIQQAALQEAQLQQALGQIKAEKEKMIKRRARMHRRGADIEELETMDLTNMDDDVRVVRRALLGVIEMQEHQTTILQDIQQSLAIVAGRAQAAPSPSGPGAWPMAYPPFSVPPMTGVSPYVAPSSIAIVSLGMPVSGGISAGTNLQVPVQTLFTQTPSQVAVTTQPAVSQPVQPQGTQPQQPVQQPVSQGPQPVVMQGPRQTQWVSKTAIAAPKPFTWDKRGEDLDTWLRAVPVYVKCKLTLLHEEVLVAASYLDGSAARWLSGLLQLQGYGHDFRAWAHAMNRIFHDYLDKFVIVYLDDILIFSKTVEEHVAHLDKVFSLLRQHKFKINGEKCEFGCTRVLYLGHEISAEGLKPDDAKVASIRDWPCPPSVTEMRSFLGITGYYRTFVKNYSVVAAPLTDLTRLDTPWEWTDKCEAAFRHLKHALTHYEVLKLPDLDEPFMVTTDASQHGIDAVLAQQEGPKLRPVEYMSKKNPSQKLAKSTYEKELYARWIEVIEQYDFDPPYLKGEYNKVADALSRRPDFSGALITEFDLTDNVTQSLVEAYCEDQFMSEIIRRLQANDKKTSAEFELVNGLVFLEKAGNKRLCVPNSESLRSLFLGECHDATGYFGYKKTEANLLQRFWWPTMMRDAQLYVETCQVCQRDKPCTQAPLGLLKPLPIPERPSESLSMDFMDTLITSKSGMRHIFVIVDRLSKYARLVAMPGTARTEYVIRMFKENWVRDFGLSKSIIIDRDVRFTSELWKVAAAEQGTQLQMTSGNHLEANGQAEQLNRAVQHLLRHYIKSNQVDWDEKLAPIASLYNNAVYSATGASEGAVFYGMVH